MRAPTRPSRIVSGRGTRLRRPLLVAAMAAGLVVAGSSIAQAQSITEKVALVSALSSEVELLLLDEPTSGLDPIMESTSRSA